MLKRGLLGKVAEEKFDYFCMIFVLLNQHCKCLINENWIFVEFLYLRAFLVCYA